jgi:hypothetical protein
MKFVETHVDLYGKVQSRITVNAGRSLALPDALEAFEYFLRGCGYNFDGHVEIVDDESGFKLEEDA